MAGRGRAEFGGLVGDFINMIVLRANCRPSLSFRDLLRQVRGAVLGALEHQDFPFALLVERLGLRRDPSRSPVFQVAFDLQRANIP